MTRIDFYAFDLLLIFPENARNQRNRENRVKITFARSRVTSSLCAEMRRCCENRASSNVCTCIRATLEVPRSPRYKPLAFKISAHYLRRSEVVMAGNTSRMVKVSEDLADAIDKIRASWEERNPTLAAGADLRRANFRAVVAALGEDYVLSLALTDARNRFVQRPSHWFEDIGISPDDDELLRDVQKELKASKPQNIAWAAEQLLYMLHAWPRTREEFEAYQRHASWSSFANETIRVGIAGCLSTARAPYDQKVNEHDNWSPHTATTLRRGPVF